MKPAPPLSNPLPGILDDEIFAFLLEEGLINERALRNFHIRRTYQALRAEGYAATEALQQLHETYPYLQLDTLRKIVYGLI